MPAFQEKFLIFLALIGVFLAITIPLSLIVYTDGDSPTEQRIAIVVSASIGSALFAITLIVAYAGIKWAHARRRQALVWITVKVLDAASRKTEQPIPAQGISDRNGSLVVSLILEQNDFIAQGDRIWATNINTEKQLGELEVVELEQDFCLCELTDRMDSNEFWVGLESRMMQQFCPPSGVRFSGAVDQDTVDFIKRLVRKWGG